MRNYYLICFSVFRACCFLSLIIVTSVSVRASANTSQPALRIVTLAPHLAEIVQQLGQQAQLVGVSAASPLTLSQTQAIVATHQGINWTTLIRSKPTHVLFWQGGNQDRDLGRLIALGQELGFQVYPSEIIEPEDVAREMLAISDFLALHHVPESIASFSLQLQQLRTQYQTVAPKKVFYYLAKQPLMSIGPSAWPNKLLSICGAQTIFTDSPMDYPQVSLTQVIQRQPIYVLNASAEPHQFAVTFWQRHQQVLDSQVISVDVDRLHRFSLTLLPAVTELCQQLRQE